MLTHFATLGITEGDSGLRPRFSNGNSRAERSFVIVRHGTIARIRDYIAGAAKEILMDCMIFPGNSGGPVVTSRRLWLSKERSRSRRLISLG